MSNREFTAWTIALLLFFSLWVVALAWRDEHSYRLEAERNRPLVLSGVTVLGPDHAQALSAVVPCTQGAKQ